MNYEDLDYVKEILLNACAEKNAKPNEVMAFLNCMLVAYCFEYGISEENFNLTLDLMKNRFKIKKEETE